MSEIIIFINIIGLTFILSYRIDSQLKKLMLLKYLILETPYIFFSVFSGYFSFTHT